jgi:hypothetical protein
MKAGITGHQDLGPPEVALWIAGSIARLIDRYRVTYGLTCLARGADQMFAVLLVEKRIPFTAVIPCRSYERTFHTKRSLEDFRHLSNLATNIISLSFDSPSEMAFFEAGKFVAMDSEILFAVWNGKTAKGLGGTADVVNVAKRNDKHVVRIDPATRGIDDPYTP